MLENYPPTMLKMIKIKQLIMIKSEMKLNNKNEKKKKKKKNFKNLKKKKNKIF